MKRIMALDIGSKFIGVAVSDPLFMTAQARKTIVRSSTKADVAQIVGMIKVDNVTELVVGHPISQDGSENPTSQMVLAFVKQLEKKISYTDRIEKRPVIRMHSERFTTQDADLILEEQGVKKRDRKKYLDELAAIMILENYISSKELDTEDQK